MTSARTGQLFYRRSVRDHGLLDHQKQVARKLLGHGCDYGLLAYIRKQVLRNRGTRSFHARVLPTPENAWNAARFEGYAVFVVLAIAPDRLARAIARARWSIRVQERRATKVSADNGEDDDKGRCR